MTKEKYQNILREIYENARDIFYNTGINLSQTQIENIMKNKGVYEKYKSEELKKYRKNKFERLLKNKK